MVARRAQAKSACVYIALLRGINVGGANILPMKDLAALCTGLGLQNVCTFIQSGNVIFRSTLCADEVRATLEQKLAKHMKKPIDVIVRTLPELQKILDRNPFKQVEASKAVIAFTGQNLPANFADTIVTPDGEQVVAHKREIYIHFPNGLGHSKLKIPSKNGGITMRNINTVTKLIALASVVAEI